MIKFPEHKASLTLSHNEHKDLYQSVREYLSHIEPSETRDEPWIDGDELWILQWYPETPIGFCRVVGPTMESVLEQAGGEG